MAERAASRRWLDWGEALTLGVALAYIAMVLLRPTRESLSDLAGMLLLFLLVFGVIAVSDRLMGEPMGRHYLVLALLAAPLVVVGVELENLRLAGVGAVVLVGMVALSSWGRRRRPGSELRETAAEPDPPE